MPHIALSILLVYGLEASVPVLQVIVLHRHYTTPEWTAETASSPCNPPATSFFCFFLIVCFTSYFVFSIAVLPHSPGVVYYHLLLRRETRIPGVTPFSFRIGIWDLFVHRGQKSYTPTAFGKLWTTPGVRCMKHASS